MPRVNLRNEIKELHINVHCAALNYLKIILLYYRDN